ncbi:dephospho-CoA kinase [Spirosoma rhododendri]|uniref:Dephospho-CoA kinase n=1 Tax=Spirosoma rhododendri TaxID=2728024 RepID=A0A7L5DH62_9BACT|nr:dephospho-CoA kinase [Spirosoma rhododendri]QJD77636.1 dephospho-CoA kinase [Spirosoma rhododendri]
MRSVFRVGVTGGIGSGKSLVCRVFESLGVPVYLADDRAKWLTEHDPILKADIVRVLGPMAYDALGHYNRSWVASQVFSNPDLLQKLNAVIHPRVRADTADWVAQQTHAPYVIKEAALMKAASPETGIDQVIVVESPLAIRTQRILKRDTHRTLDDIQRIIANQVSDEQRRQFADHILVNDDSQLLLPQIWSLHQQFLAQAQPANN